MFVQDQFLLGGEGWSMAELYLMFCHKYHPATSTDGPGVSLSPHYGLGRALGGKYWSSQVQVEEVMCVNLDNADRINKPYRQKGRAQH